MRKLARGSSGGMDLAWMVAKSRDAACFLRRRIGVTGRFVGVKRGPGPTRRYQNEQSVAESWQ